MRKILTVTLVAHFLHYIQPVKAYALDGSMTGEYLGYGIGVTMLYGLVGILLMLIGYKVVDFITPGNLGKEITENRNVALSILVGSMMLGLCIIIAAAIAG
jgi:hypothetical protein